VVEPFWGDGKEEAHQKNELYGEVWSVGGERRLGRRPEVVVDSSRCWEVVYGDAVLGAWSNRSEKARAGCPWRLSGGGNGGAVGGKRRRRKKGCSTVGVGTL
jgi:hypothetical protein